MFNTEQSKGEQMQTKIMEQLDESKKRYDRQLYADWILRVYDKCSLACLHSRKSKIIKEAIEQEKDDPVVAEQLLDYEKNCGRNCIRKYDKTYKLFES